MAIATRQRGLVAVKSRSVGWKIREYGGWYMMILPNLLNFAVFSIFSWVFLFGISFTRWNMLGAKRWIGVKNYLTMANNEVFVKSIVNTAQYALMYVLPLALVSLVLALLVNQELRGVYFFRALYYLPVVTTMAVIALIWLFIIKPNPDGVLNYLIGLVGIPYQEWLLNPRLALPTLALMSIWKQMGYYMLLWVAGLLAIPGDLYEAATIDGASRPQLFWYITVPMLRPTTTFILMIATIGAFQMFGPTYMMTGGGPTYSTMTLVYFMWVRAFEFMRMGESGAIAVVLFLIILVISLIQKRLLRWGEELYA